MENLEQGLTISIAGMFITFLSLGMFILVMVVLKRLFPSRKENRKMPDSPESQIPQTGDYGDEEQTSTEIAAAIAIAIKKVQTRRQSQLGRLLVEPRRPGWDPGFQRPPIVRQKPIKHP